MRIKAGQLFSSFLLAGTLFVSTVSSAGAASTVMQLTPDSGSFTSSFTLDLVIDGQGDVFNAAKAEIVIPSGLKVKDLVLGDCGFSFLSTPSVVNPSFEGVILGSSSEKCTVYSISLLPVETGEVSIEVENAAVQRYGDAADVLATAQGGSYSLTAADETVEGFDLDQVEQPAEGLYTVLLRTYSDQGPESSAQITIKNVDSGEETSGNTDETGNAQFAGIAPGIYTVAVEKDGTEYADTILNVSGDNKVLSLGIKLRAKPVEAETQPKSQVEMLLGNKMLLAIIGGLVVVILLLVGMMLKNRSSNK